MRYYTYAYLREDKTPYYIGKGQGKRAYVRYGRRIPTPPEDRILILKYFEEESDAFKHEIYMISLLPNLHNLTKGGEGISGYRHTDATREIMGYEWTEDQRRRQSEVMTGKKRGRYDAWGTDEERLERRRKRGRDATRRYRQHLKNK